MMFLLLSFLLPLHSCSGLSNENLISFPNNNYFWFNSPDLSQHHSTNPLFQYKRPPVHIISIYPYETKETFTLPIMHREKFIDYSKVKFPSYDLDSVIQYHKESNLPPPYTNQQYEVEKDDMRLYTNIDTFEAYGAAYLVHKNFFINKRSKAQAFKLSNVNCEMASLFYFQTKFGKDRTMIMQSLDLFDFSVVHLSAYERKLKSHALMTFKRRGEFVANFKNYTMDVIKELKPYFESVVYTNSKEKPIQYHPRALKTVVIMPFLGNSYGAGHSSLSNRFLYLYSCFWSFYETYPNIVIFVKLEADRKWILEESGLPFYDVVLLENLPKDAALPFATVIDAFTKALDGSWASKFDYIFFTESDQLLIMRDMEHLYSYLDKNQNSVISPHRLYPLHTAMTEKHFNVDLSSQNDTSTWMTKSCCYSRSPDTTRAGWKRLADNMSTFNLLGTTIPLAQGHFLAESFNFCTLMDRVKYVCP